MLLLKLFKLILLKLSVAYLKGADEFTCKIECNC